MQGLQRPRLGLPTRQRHSRHCCAARPAPFGSAPRIRPVTPHCVQTCQGIREAPVKPRRWIFAA
jgi:hypothetical protein